MPLQAAALKQQAAVRALPQAAAKPFLLPEFPLPPEPLPEHWNLDSEQAFFRIPPPWPDRNRIF